MSEFGYNELESAEPLIINDEPTLGVDAEKTAIVDLMHELEVSEETIGNTTILIDSNNRLASNGTAYPAWYARLRFANHPILSNAQGPVARISSQVRGRERSEEEMNRTLTHELSHVAQMDRNDRGQTLGRIMVRGGAIMGAVAANLLAKNSKHKTAATIAGFVFGFRTGYQFAPHECQARKIAERITTSAISRR